MNRFVTVEAVDAATLALSGTSVADGAMDPREVAAIALRAGEAHIADAVLADLDTTFKRAGVEAGLNTLLLHHFSQIISNYRKAVAGK